MTFHTYLRYFVWILIVLSTSFCAGKKKSSSGKSVKTVAQELFADTISNVDEPAPYLPKKYGYKPSATRYFDLIHTKLEVTPDWETQTLKGIATLTLVPYFYSQQTLELDAKGFIINSISLLNEKKLPAQKLKYTYDDEKIRIDLGKSYTRNEQIHIEIDYIAQPEKRKAGGSSAITSDKGLYFINPKGENPDKPKQIWTQGEPKSSSCWFPTIDEPNERCTQEIHITVDTSYVTLSNGVLQYSTFSKGKRTDVWEQKLPHAPYLFMMAVGKFAVIKDKWRDIELTYLVEPEYAPYAKNIFGNTPEMLEFFSNKLGVKYPWEKYAQVIVRDFVSGAMENTSAVVFMEAVQSDDRELLERDWDDIIAHEMFHHWFGDLVTLESWANLPLNESFADYSEYLWYEYKHGKDAADFHGLEAKNSYFEEAKEKREPLIRFYHDKPDDMFDRHSYAKGGRILHYLRYVVGDEAFFESLKRYLRANAFKSVEIHNLRMAFEEVTGQDLNWFFNTYFLAAGHPEVKVETEYDSTSGKLFMLLEQKQDTNHFPIYRMPLEIEVMQGGKARRFNFTLEKPVQLFSFELEGKPDNIILDPDHRALVEWEYDKPITYFINQYHTSTSAVSRNLALYALADYKHLPEVQEIFLKALLDNNHVNRETAISMIPELLGDSTLRPKIELILAELAENDPKPQVQAAAIEVLAALDAERYVSIFEKGLNARPYSVVAESLAGLISANPENAAQYVARVQHINGGPVIGVIADYYAAGADTASFNWFIKSRKKLKGMDEYTFVQNFGKYVLRLEDAGYQQKGIKVLSDWAENSKSFGLKIGAFQMLGLFTDRPGINELRKTIIENETNRQIKGILEALSNMN
jgi:aminopeptidase N